VKVETDSPQATVAAVIGWPISQSLSPVIHNAAFRHHGDNWSYVAYPIEPGDAGSAIAAMRGGGLQGLNVTMPHKDAVADLVDELDESAESIHAVNTVVRMSDGRLRGYSTDGEGLLRAIRINANWDPAGKKVCVLGAGGAARSAIDAFTRAGVASIFVVNRTVEKATQAIGESKVAVVGSQRNIDECDIVFNATSVGMGTDESLVSPELLHEGQLVIDAVYHPLETRLLRDAKSRGATVLDGLWMLIHQACVAQALWLGREPDYQVMRNAAVRELAARGN
jgi:shikimate dehydrogenase